MGAEPLPLVLGQQPGKVHSERLAAFDVARCLAAVWVVFYHYGFSGFASKQTTLAAPDVVPLLPYGYLGVDIFFVISGFFIFKTADGRSWQEFLVARVSRLYPALAICTTLIVAVGLAVELEPVAQAVRHWIGGVTLASFVPFGGTSLGYADSVYWTLAIEFRFYALVGILLAFRLPLGRLGQILLLLSVTNLGWAHLAGTKGSNLVNTLTLSGYASHFLFGAAIYLMSRPATRSQAWILGIPAALLMSAHIFQAAADRIERKDVILSGWVALAMVWLAIALLCLQLARRWQPSCAKLTALAGGVSYPLYLIHRQIAYWLADRFAFQPSWLTIFLLATGAILVALAIHVLLEQRLIRSAKNILSHLLGVTTAPRNQKAPHQDRAG